MPLSPSVVAPTRWERNLTLLVFALCLGFNFWGVQVGWRSLNLPGHEFRQAQTALSAFQIQKDGDFSVDYPTPVLGKPWAIPLEFPLYQWTVVAVSNVSGWGLVPSARTVSAGCFYLLLPAVYLLLGNLGVAPIRRWLVLALVVTSPLYIFYSRACLIETMALMFSLWFCVGFVQAVEQRSWVWLLVAVLAGTGAGLVKVTTFVIYLLPVAAWAGHRLWAARAKGNWCQEGLWMARVAAIPFAATLWWEHHAEATRALNPLAHFLNSKNLRSFVFGTWPDRISPELWLQKWQTTTGSVTWWPVLGGALVLAFFSTRERMRQGVVAIGIFALTLVVFPVLYGFHDYYFMANGVLLLAALGLILVGVAEKSRWRGLTALLVLALAGAQGWRYTEGYYHGQQGISEGGDGLTLVLRDLVKADEAVVVVGQQWNPMLPYYAQRRAMMIREIEETNPARLDAAFAGLSGERIGAVVIASAVQHPGEFLRRAAVFGIGNQPLYRWRDMTIYLREDRRDASVRLLQGKAFHEVAWIPGVEPKPERLAGNWIEVARLDPAKREFFSTMSPQPVRAYSSFGPGVETIGELKYFGAHPVTRLVFRLPAGAHTLRTTVWLPPAAFDPAQPGAPLTDGVEIALVTLGRDGARRPIHTMHFDPANEPTHREVTPFTVAFALGEESEVELFFGPGPNGRDTRDWIKLGRLEIE